MSESVIADSDTVAIISEALTAGEVWSSIVLDVFGSSDNVVALNEDNRS